MRRARFLVLGAALGLIASSAIPACTEEDSLRLPATPDGGAGGALLDAGTDDGPPGLDADGLCGNEIHQAIANAPNIYFVLDASGSMADSNGGPTRFAKVRTAVIGVLRSLGPLINVGLALFPVEASAEEPCRTGEQVLSVKPGDPKTGEDGPTTKAFLSATSIDPLGGTPTAATLSQLAPALTELEGKTIVVLATDGGPNCNANATCGISECMANIEGACPPDTNCCEPDQPYGPESCLDRGPTLDAVSSLAKLGIEVYVIGIPGSETYASVLSQMAIIGGAATETAPFYYQVSDLSTLEQVLGDIAGIVVSCEFELPDPPEEPGFTNVYLDGELLPFDSENGWDWKTDSVVVLHGDACARLKNGEVAQVQIVSGCPTEGPK